MPSATRLVSLVLCDGQGAVLGHLDPVEVPGRHWPEVEAVVTVARARWGIEVTVLRLLTTTEPYDGGRVAYLAQVTSGEPPRGALHTVEPAEAVALAADGDHRLWWAVPGALDGLAADLDVVLTGVGRVRTGPLRQRKTWNLSLVVTAPTTHGDVWFKAVPPFLADEGAVIARVGAVDPELVPMLLAHDAGRRAVLMERVPGQDQWGLADETVIRAMVDRWVAAQTALVGDVDHLLAVGAADSRSMALVTAAWDLLDREDVRAGLSAHELAVLEDLVDGLPRRMERVEECGLPDTLVHGDLHPGNWRRDGSRLTLLDWGDVRVGNPVLDLRAFTERLEPPDPSDGGTGTGLRERVREHWVRAWESAVPGSDPGRALGLLEAVAELVAATTYQRFLDHIEETERVYHRLDVGARVRAAVRATGK